MKLKMEITSNKSEQFISKNDSNAAEKANNGMNMYMIEF